MNLKSLLGRTGLFYCPVCEEANSFCVIQEILVSQGRSEDKKEWMKGNNQYAVTLKILCKEGHISYLVFTMHAGNIWVEVSR